jgi:iron-sulfur cluster assembly protein
MLILTEEAVAAIRTLTAGPGPNESGLRIIHLDSAGALALSISSGPESGDEVIQTGGVRVFLQPGAAAMLSNHALSARIDEQEGVVFRIDDRQPAW